MRPVDTQKSTVAGPRPWRFGPRELPDASAAWQLEQFNSNKARPGATYALGGRWYVMVAVALVADFNAALAGGVVAWADAPAVSSPTTATPATRRPGNK